MKFSLETIIDILKDHSLRITESRKAVAQTLLNSKGKYLSADELYQKILNSNEVTCDPVSVYRILAKFEELKIVKKSEFNNEATRYLLANQNAVQGHHEHYFKCNNCLTIEPFKGCFVSKIEKDLEEKGYTDLSHHLEITGLCPKCVN